MSERSAAVFLCYVVLGIIAQLAAVQYHWIAGLTVAGVLFIGAYLLGKVTADAEVTEYRDDLRKRAGR